MCPDSGSICRDSLPLRIHSCGHVLSSLFRGLFGVEQDPAELAGNGVVLLFLFLFAIIWKSSLEEGGLSAAEWQSRKHVWEWKLNLKIKMLLELRNASRRYRCRGILELWKEGRLLSSSSDTLRKVPCFPSDPLPALSFQVLCAESWDALFSCFLLSLNSERRGQVVRGGEWGQGIHVFNVAFLLILEAGSYYLTQSGFGLLPKLPKCWGYRRARTHSDVQRASLLACCILTELCLTTCLR